jgi:hypothetical protein
MKTRSPRPEKRSVVRDCTRCGVRPGEHRWVAGSRSAERHFPEFYLCVVCLGAMRTYFANGRRKADQAYKGDRPS